MPRHWEKEMKWGGWHYFLTALIIIFASSFIGVLIKEWPILLNLISEYPFMGVILWLLTTAIAITIGYIIFLLIRFKKQLKDKEDQDKG